MSEFKQAFRPEVVANAVKQPEFATLASRAKRRRRGRSAAVVAAAVAVAGVVASVGWTLGRPGGGGGPGPAPAAGGETPFTVVGEAVAAAYEASGLAYVRQFGFVLPQHSQDLTLLTTRFPDGAGNWDDTFDTEEQSLAVYAGNFSFALIELPESPSTAALTLADGMRVEVPIADASATFDAMNAINRECGIPCPVLTVTGAELSETQILLESGVATVPAWLFTVDGLKAPIARVALAADATGDTALRTPGEILGDDHRGRWMWVESAAVVPGEPNALDVDFVGGACDVSRTAFAHETPQVVVVGVEIIASGDVCIDIGITATARVTLDDPVGDRVLLTVGGQPVPVR